uniref:(California timema) hypothetical protein n=1 Tax=Timema californicum TaxID=61474 RepID=A0A7R9IX92_TIMCA|nr:unnamed protein product [Timema californicum]
MLRKKSMLQYQIAIATESLSKQEQLHKQQQQQVVANGKSPERSESPNSTSTATSAGTVTPPTAAASPRLPSTGRHSVRLGQRLSVLKTLTRHSFLVVTISEGSEAGTNTVLVSRDGDESRAWPSSGELRLRDQL